MAALLSASPLPGQASRNWRPEERSLVTDLSYVTAIAATRRLVYVSTPNGLGVYDRGLLAWRVTVGPLDGWPGGWFTAMAANPDDDTAWLGGQGRWLSYDPFTRRIDGGALPGAADQVVLDANDPARGAYFHTAAGWYFVARGSFTALPTPTPPTRRLGSLSPRELAARLPAFDAVRFRVERDDQLRTWRISAAAQAPLTGEIFLGTDGNGAHRVDPVTYATERLPAGLLGGAATSIAAYRGQLCAAGDARVARAVRFGIACFDESLRHFTYHENQGLAGLPAAGIRRLLVTERAVWAATDQGLMRAPRRGGRAVLVQARDGLPGDVVLSLAPAPHGVYAGTESGLAEIADSGRGVVVVAATRGPAVLALTAAPHDTLWAGTAAGVVGFLLPLGDAVVRPEGPMPLREPVTAIAARGDTILATSASRLLLRDGAGWHAIDVPGRPIGRLAAVAPDADGWWIAGDQGFAFFDDARGLWNALATPADVPLPVRDMAATRDHVWLATEAGVVRYEKRVLFP